MELFQRLNAVIQANIQSTHYLNKTWVLSSPHKYVFIDSSLFSNFILFISVLQNGLQAVNLEGCFFFFFMSFLNCLLKQYHVYSGKPNAIVRTV